MVKAMTNLPAYAPASRPNLTRAILVEGVMTAFTVQATAWRVWQSWTDMAVQRLAATANTSGGCLRKPMAVAGKSEPAWNGRNTGGAFELFEEGDGTHRFRLVAAGGEVILTSRCYRDAKSARSGMRSLMKNAVLDDRYERMTDKLGTGYFVIRAGNNRVLWSSASFESIEVLEENLRQVVRTARLAAAQ
jgi:hypothetical protein